MEQAGIFSKMTFLGFKGLGHNYVNGLILTVPTTATIGIATGRCRDSTDVLDMVVSSPLTADITTSGAGGLDTGSEAADTWYAVHIIGDTTATNAPDCLLSLSATSPTIPVGYDVARRIGWTRNDSGSDFEVFLMYGNSNERTVEWDGVSQILTNGSATSFTSVDCSVQIPPTSERAYFKGEFNLPAATDDVGFRPDGGSSSISLMRNNQLGVANTGEFRTTFWCNVDSSQSIEYISATVNCDTDLKVMTYVDYI